MRVFRDGNAFLRLSTFILVIHVVISIMPSAHAMPAQSQKADQEVQNHEQKERLFKRHLEHQVIKNTKVALPHRLLATKLALGAMLANGAKIVLSGKAALHKKLANAARTASRIKLTLGTIIKSSQPNFHLIGSEEALNGDDETFRKWFEGDEVRKVWTDKEHKTIVSVLESVIGTKIAVGGMLMGWIKRELEGKASLAEKFAWAAKVASREKIIMALRMGSDLGLEDDMPLPKYDTLSDDQKWKTYLEELEKFAEKHGVEWNRIVLG